MAKRFEFLTMTLRLLQWTWKAETSGQGECFVHVRYWSMPQRRS